MISSYGCDHMTADAEFLLSKAKYKAVTGREQRRDADVLCYQIRQSFKPGEITPEEANRIGYETAMRWTKGKYAFFVATHTDKAAHPQSHLLQFDLAGLHPGSSGTSSALAVRCGGSLTAFVLKMICPSSPTPSCTARGDFSITGHGWGRSGSPHTRSSYGLPSDELLPKRPDDFDAFLRLMEASGYTVKHGRGGVISFLVPGQQRAARFRASTLGDGYGPEDVQAVIDGKAPTRTAPVRRAPAPRRVNLIVDIQERLRSGQRSGL